MTVRLVSHVNGDGDLIEAWLRHYLRLGIASFHLIVHGSNAENRKLLSIKDQFPIFIVDSYDSEYSVDEKKKRIDSVLATLADQWLLLVDSDEFVEFPLRETKSTVRALELARGNVLQAPMLQRMTRDGSLNTPETIDDPFRTLPLCSVSLYEKMGTKASINKFPLFYCTKGTTLSNGGNHRPPLGIARSGRSFLGVTHHFKFRKPVLQRLNKRIDSSHSHRHESVRYLDYLEKHDHQLPLEDSFEYSRGELFRRGLLRGFSLKYYFHQLTR